MELVKTKKSKRTNNLADVAKSFIKYCRQSGLRTECTPYMHIIGTYLAEQDENENLPAFDMQGVEKSDDLLSRLYFSSSNRARNPLRSMIQNLYRRLQMNFTEPSEREAMRRFALTRTFNDIESDNGSDLVDSTANRTPDSSHSETNLSDSNRTDDESSFANDGQGLNQAPPYFAQNNFSVNRSKNRWRSFRQK